MSGSTFCWRSPGQLSHLLQLQSISLPFFADKEGAIIYGAINSNKGPYGCSAVVVASHRVLPYTLEAYFENPNYEGVREPCHYKCSFCRADHLELTTTFRRAALVSFLSTKVFLQGPVTVAKLIKRLGDNKGKLFTTPVYKLNQGVIHALVLQLLAAGILAIYLIDEDKEGTDRLSHFVSSIQYKDGVHEDCGRLYRWIPKQNNALESEGSRCQRDSLL
jgi:hypothetical protein